MDYSANSKILKNYVNNYVINCSISIYDNANPF